MIIDHCYHILVNGISHYRADEYDITHQVYDRLKTGVRVRSLNGLKSALIMIELLRVEQKTADAPEVARYFNNFVTWSMRNLPIEMTLALVKYAIKDRQFAIKQDIREGSGWKLLVQDYKPILLVPDEQAKASPVYRKMMRYAANIATATTNARIAIEGDTVKPKRRKSSKVLELETA